MELISDIEFQHEQGTRGGAEYILKLKLGDCLNSNIGMHAIRMPHGQCATAKAP